MALTTAQRSTLKAAILSEQDAAFATMRAANNEQGMADWYNAAGAFVAWKSAVTVRDTGQAFNGAEWAALSAANHTRLQTVAQYLTNYSPSIAGIRAMFDDIWSGTGGVQTRAALLALWKRLATRGERVFATGTGSDASPGLLTFEGRITAQDISDSLRA